ncbi:MAG TPA: hypothetical protein VGQ73_02980, partial [Gemmatimonadales bacterium]|nr:hypothetical protein [Gemmatimonadales bacterium]
MATPMFTSIRKYNGAPLLTEELVKKQDELNTALQAVPGFHAYSLVKLGEGAISMTVCDNRAGAEESNRVEAAWLKDKRPTFTTRPPEIWTGEL